MSRLHGAVGYAVATLFGLGMGLGCLAALTSQAQSAEAGLTPVTSGAPPAEAPVVTLARGGQALDRKSVV